jgi:hypothetical protein
MCDKAFSSQTRRLVHETSPGDPMSRCACDRDSELKDITPFRDIGVRLALIVLQTSLRAENMV